jgi:cyanophycinase
MSTGPLETSPSPVFAAAVTSPAGPLLAIGGAEDKMGKRSVLRAFVALAGGADARIAVVPTASSLGPEVVDVYTALFRRLGAAEVVSARPESRVEANDPSMAARLADVTGIFLTGGNQLKLSAVVNGTAFGEAIRAAHQRGATVAGTSAGASIQSSHMVAFGSGGATPKQRMTQLAAGLGLVDSCVIDQHFDQRNRYGRLLMIVAQSPSLLGIGGPAGHRTRRGHHLRRQGRGLQRPRGPAHRSSSCLRRGAARAARRVGLRPHVTNAARPGHRGGPP